GELRRQASSRRRRRRLDRRKETSHSTHTCRRVAHSTAVDASLPRALGQRGTSSFGKDQTRAGTFCQLDALGGMAAVAEDSSEQDASTAVPCIRLPESSVEPVYGLSPELLVSLALRRLYRGGLAQSGVGYVDYGYRTPDYLAGIVYALIEAGLLALAEQEPWGLRRVHFTDAGQARYAQLPPRASG
nr:hypothetical protein [Actinomycetota bacterium]